MGQKMTRCPCYAKKSKCGETCKCYNCRNFFAARNTNNIKDSPKLKRKKILWSPPSLKRHRETHYVKENNIPMANAGWTQLETCILQITESFLYPTSVLPRPEYIHQLYNFVVQSNTARSLEITASVKTCAQIYGKLSYLKKRQEEIRRLHFGIHAVIWEFEDLCNVW